MPRPPQGGAGTENEDELGAMPTTTGAGEQQQAASAADPAGLAEIIAKAKERAAVAAGQAQRLATNASESATKHSASLRAQAASTAAEMTSSVATADARARLVTDAKVKALTMTASAHQQVVRGQAMRGVVPAGIVAERLGIEYEDAEGNPLPGYDTELVVALRQLDTTAAVLKSLVEIGEQTHAASESLAFSHSQIGAAATAEGARLEAMPPADRSPGPVRPAPQVTQAEAYYTALVGELGDAYSALGESSAALAGSVGPMRERAQVIGAKVVDDVLLTVSAHHKWIQDERALQTQLETLRAAERDVSHAEARAGHAAHSLARQREGVLLKVQLLEDKRREMMKRWLLDYMGMQSRFFSSASQAFPPTPRATPPPSVQRRPSSPPKKPATAPETPRSRDAPAPTKLPAAPAPAPATPPPAPTPAPAPATPPEPAPAPDDAVTETAAGDAAFDEAEAFAEANDWASCVSRVEEALALGCTDEAQAHYLHGVALGEVDRPADAATALRKCLALNPTHEHVVEELQVATEAAIAAGEMESPRPPGGAGS